MPRPQTLTALGAGPRQHLSALPEPPTAARLSCRPTRCTAPQSTLAKYTQARIKPSASRAAPPARSLRTLINRNIREQMQMKHLQAFCEALKINSQGLCLHYASDPTESLHISPLPSPLLSPVFLEHLKVYFYLSTAAMPSSRLPMPARQPRGARSLGPSRCGSRGMERERADAEGCTERRVGGSGPCSAAIQCGDVLPSSENKQHLPTNLSPDADCPWDHEEVILPPCFSFPIHKVGIRSPPLLRLREGLGEG